LWKPVCCQTCQQNFCQSCISTWLLKNNNTICPNHCQFIEFKSPPILRSLLSDLKLKCIYYNKGCVEIQNVDSLEKHESLCKYHEKLCNGCQTLFPQNILEAHKASCPFVKIPCDECNKELSRLDLKEHELDCLKIAIKSLKSTYEQKLKELTEQNEKLIIRLNHYEKTKA